MLLDNLAALFLLYLKPISAISRILDRGKLWFAVAAAVAVSFLLMTGQARYLQQGQLAADNSTQAASAVQPGRSGMQSPGGIQVPDGADPTELVARNSPLAGVINAAKTWIMLPPASLILPLGALTLAFVPVLIALRALSGFGSFGVLMRSDYLALLMCALLSWAAAYLPVALVNFWMPYAPLQYVWLYGAAQLFFVVLAALSVRTFTGASAISAIGVTAIAWTCAIGALVLFSAAGSVRGFLMSPFLLYYAYSLFRSDFTALGDGLRSRQNLRNQLEIATNNPKDADAHYQLGLIYQKRRQYTEAIARFEKAIAIDPQEGDTLLQLGRIALEQNRIPDAIRFLEKSVRIDDKLSSSEGLRDLGNAYLQANRPNQAAEALKKYADRRPYDPEGLYWFGKSLAMLGNASQARERFEECVEAVNTSPKHRRAQVRRWASEAQSELKSL